MAMISCLVLVALVFPPRVKSDDSNQKTIVTFSNRVEIPGGKVLPAGRYVFKLLDSASDRNIVQIFNEDGTHLYATILAIANYRLRPTDETVMTFRARAAGSPEALRAWFCPGASWGQEFVYPKTRAVKLAKLTHKPVPSMPSELASSIGMPAKSVNAPAIIALKEAPLKAVEPTGEEVAISIEMDRLPLAFEGHPRQGEVPAKASPVLSASPITKNYTVVVSIYAIAVLIIGAVILAAWVHRSFVRARSAGGETAPQRWPLRVSPQPPGRVFPFRTWPKEPPKKKRKRLLR
jgi:hypothetical protein